MAVSKRKRFEVFKRDQFTCQYCWRQPPAVVLEADHVVAVSAGGPDDIHNLVTACFDCNRGKSNVPLDSVPEQLSRVMEVAQEKAEQLRAYNDFLMEQREAEDELIHRLGAVYFDPLCKPADRGQYTFGGDAANTVRQFLRRLPYAEVLEAIELAQARIPAGFKKDDKRFRYFCGICWNKIRRREGS